MRHRATGIELVRILRRHAFRTLATVALLGAVDVVARAQALLWDASGATAEKIGSSLAFVADVDGDGVRDLVAAGNGFVRLLSGANGTTIRTITLSDSELNVAAIDDVDGD